MTKMIVFTVATLMLIRGLLTLFVPDTSSEWNNLLGIGGLATAEAQFGSFIGSIMRIAALIEARLWIIAAFPLFLRLYWGRDVTILVAGIGAVVQVFRLAAGEGVSAIVWCVIFIGIAALFFALPGIKAYFPPQTQNADKTTR